MNYFKLIILLTLLQPQAFSSGNTSGSGGKSSGQVQRGSSQYITTLDKKKSKSFNIDSNKNSDFYDHNYKDYSIFLKKYIHTVNKSTTQVDYKSLNMKTIENYLNKSLEVTKSQINTWNKKKQITFYINLYNALTIKLIKDNYPISSIKSLGSGFPLFRSPWKKKFFSLFGTMSNLDTIEHELARGNKDLKDPLLHFAFNCASIGCPAIINTPYNESELESQLQNSTKRFLQDRSRNYLVGNTLHVSSIFKWYRSDFEEGIRGIKSLRDFFAMYALSLTSNEKERKLLISGNYKLVFDDYDWSLNKVK